MFFFSWKPKITRDFYGVFHLVINGGYLNSYFFFIFYVYFGELILEWSMIFSPIYIMCTLSWIFDYFWLFHNTQVLSIGPHEVGPEYRLQAPPRYVLFIYFSLIMMISLEFLDNITHVQDFIPKFFTFSKIIYI